MYDPHSINLGTPVESMCFTGSKIIIPYHDLAVQFEVGNNFLCLHRKFKIKHKDSSRVEPISLRDMNEGLRNVQSPRASTSAYTYSEASRNNSDNGLPIQSSSDTPLSSSRANMNSTASSEWGDQELQSDKLGLTRTRHSSSHVTVNQDLVPGPPVFNFNEPNGMPAGTPVQVNTHFQGFPDVPPADADTIHYLMPIQPVSSRDDHHCNQTIDLTNLMQCSI